jgi:hypothetical protein
MKSIRGTSLFLLLLPVLSLLGNGCASTQGSARLVTPPKADVSLVQFSNLIVEVESKQGISLTSSDKERILNLIVQNIRVDASDRFKAINQTNSGPSALHASVMIKRYEEGNAFARAMLVGLGQMHIDADVALSNWETKESIAQYEVSKTFAWGGLYGGLTDIKDVEDGFAKAVAASILGRKE